MQNFGPLRRPLTDLVSRSLRDTVYSCVVVFSLSAYLNKGIPASNWAIYWRRRINCERAELTIYCTAIVMVLGTPKVKWGSHRDSNGADLFTDDTYFNDDITIKSR